MRASHWEESVKFFDFEGLVEKSVILREVKDLKSGDSMKADFENNFSAP